jgi:uncharacterized membrane protein YfcA
VSLALGAALGALGLLGGFIAGLVGVGGAIVVVPLLYYVPPLLGVGRFDMHAVSGITMVQVFVAALSGMVAHSRAGAVHTRLAWVGGVSMAVATLLGALGSVYVSERFLLLVFALMATGAVLFLFKPLGTEADARRAGDLRFDPGRAILVAGGVGLAAGLIGAGGAFLLVPLLIAIVGIPIRIAIGTSLGIVALASAAGVAGKAVVGQVVWLPALVVAAAALVGAQAGAAASHRLPGVRLQQILGVVVVAAALRVWWDVFRP